MKAAEKKTLPLFSSSHVKVEFFHSFVFNLLDKMTIEAASAAPAVPAALNIDDASAVSDDPAFDRLFGRDADGAPLWLRTEELLRIDDGENVDDDEDNAGVGADENGENKSEETAASEGKKKKGKRVKRSKDDEFDNEDEEKAYMSRFDDDFDD